MDMWLILTSPEGIIYVRFDDVVAMADVPEVGRGGHGLTGKSLGTALTLRHGGQVLVTEQVEEIAKRISEFRADA